MRDVLGLGRLPCWGLGAAWWWRQGSLLLMHMLLLMKRHPSIVP